MTEPYRAVEILMNKGLRLIKQHWLEGVVGCLADLVPDVGASFGHGVEV